MNIDGMRMTFERGRKAGGRLAGLPTGLKTSRCYSKNKRKSILVASPSIFTTVLMPPTFLKYKLAGPSR
ncbi:hypothetical protein T265_07531 [Opisthorchis viverrini]|uniref:Uncharacterized protein n=1 Tax=Opisthorchis viverrini TaxID=6198 RepID=A0A074ZCL6_OPIVI|nr:hypothetical protein T265_07531 [Opisthorchis viverrini]KER24908.1 hypothetical protein T265_07531 [Opisthorchis viverrini]